MPTIEQIKTLRHETGISIGQCREALQASAGDLTKAKEWLQAKGSAIAERKSDRVLKAGVIGAYVHTNGLIAALVELVSETDFVAKNPEFKSLADDLAMHVSAFEPSDVEALLVQPFIRDQAQTVKQVITSAIQKFGEKIEVVRFVRLLVGEK